MSFTVGEEVLVDGLRYVISFIEGDPPHRYRLLASTRDGVQVLWAAPDRLQKISAYTRPRDDTNDVVRFR